MKIRIKNNSLRLRLTQSEVSNLVEEKELWDFCDLIGGGLKYGIVCAEIDSMKASISDSTIEVRLSNNLVTDWDKNNKIGFNSTMDNGTFILIEKDFKCLVDREDEDESNMYPNPLAKS